MRSLIFPTMLLAAAFTAFSLHGADVSPFANFAGSYSKHGTVKISEGGGTAASGKVQQNFHIGSTGESARLKITGTIEFDGATRPFSATYIFKRRNGGGIDVAAISNLAPGLDDGHASEGTYAVFPRKITADVPFVFGTTTGKATLLLRLKKRKRGVQLIATQTLFSSALLRPITWTFKALAR
jgi:hypothetical protein